mgnify:FL=1
MSDTKQNAFTLIELSIVLVAIGLLIGGILVGQNLIFAAQIQQQVKQIQEYSQAYTMFQSKYNCIPGDCYNATTFFSSATNGNGNGQLNGSLTYDADWNFNLEKPGFFTHLLLSGLIETDEQITRLGYPQHKFPHEPDQGFMAASDYDTSAPSGAGSFTSQSDDYFGMNKWKIALYFTIGNPKRPWGWKNDNHGLFTPAVTYALDTKIDDGKPQTGDFKGGTIEWTNTNGYTDGYCLTPTPPSLPVAAGLGTEYNISNTKTPCIFAWKLE